MYDVICVGSATVDAFAQTDRKFCRNREFRFPIGAKLLLQHLEFHTGGSATNTAVAFSRLGLKTAAICELGKGSNSERVISALKREKVDTSLICCREGRTGFSIILDAEGRDRTIFAFKGSNNDLNYSHIMKNKAKLKARWLYLGSMLGRSWETLKKLAAFAEKNRIKLAFNPSLYLASKGTAYNKEILKRASALIMNKEEAKALTGKKNAADCMRILKKLGPEYVVITDGSKPIEACGRSRHYTLIPRKVKIVETTGAGDAFASSFIAGLIKTDDTETALKIALANSESVITHYGAKNRLLTWNEAMRNARRHQYRIIERQWRLFPE